jgi:hypothetical protein
VIAAHALGGGQCRRAALGEPDSAGYVSLRIRSGSHACVYSLLTILLCNHAGAFLKF